MKIINYTWHEVKWNQNTITTRKYKNYNQAQILKLQLYSRSECSQGRLRLSLLCLAVFVGAQHSQEGHREGREDETEPGRGRSPAWPHCRTGRSGQLACGACCAELSGRLRGEESYPAWTECPEESWGSHQLNEKLLTLSLTGFEFDLEFIVFYILFYFIVYLIVLQKYNSCNKMQ